MCECVSEWDCKVLWIFKKGSKTLHTIWKNSLSMNQSSGWSAMQSFIFHDAQPLPQSACIICIHIDSHSGTDLVMGDSSPKRKQICCSVQTDPARLFSPSKTHQSCVTLSSLPLHWWKAGDRIWLWLMFSLGKSICRGSLTWFPLRHTPITTGLWETVIMACAGASCDSELWFSTRRKKKISH